MNTLSPRSLRLRAIFLPAVVVLAAWLFNVIALQAHAPQPASVSLFVFAALSAGLVWHLSRRAQESGVRRGGIIATALAATVVWYLASAALPAPGSERQKIGDRGTRPGGGFTMSVTNDFQRPQLETLLVRARELGPSGALAEFTCHDPVPDFQFELTLRPAGEYNERLVDVAYTPRLDEGRRDRCLGFGLSYLFDTAVASIDHGPPIDYGYVNPSTGKKLGPYVRGALRKPICRCDLRQSGREWVAWSQKGAEELTR